MMQELLGRAFPDGRPLVHGSFRTSTRFATQWTRYLGAAGDAAGAVAHQFEFVLEMDPGALGAGGSRYTQRCCLLADDQLQPLRYTSRAGGRSLTLRFELDAVKAELHDGSVLTIERNGASFPLEANITGLQALLLLRAHLLGQLGSEARFTILAVNQLLVSPYRTFPASDLGPHGLRSSFQEELQLDDDGRLVLARPSTPGFETRCEEAALPSWIDEDLVSPQAIRYQPPPEARFRLLDLEVPGSVTPLGATLTVPDGELPRPGILFIGGSGIHNRHGIAGEVDIGTHEIVDHLADQGFTGLRYDTRGAGTTRLGADALDQGLQTKLDDARAALAFLRSRSEVDPTQVTLIGHSEGGHVALLLAAADSGVRGVVLLASIGRGIDELLAEQTRTQAEKLGLDEAQIEDQLRQLDEFVARVRSGQQWVSGQMPDHLYLGVRSRRWFAEHLRESADEVIRRIRCPFLLCQGERDLQISPSRDAERLYRAAREAGVAIEYVLFPGLDHLFKPVPDGEPAQIEQYFDASRHVAGEVLETITRWLSARTGDR